MKKRKFIKNSYILYTIVTILIIAIIYNAARAFSLYKTGGVGVFFRQAQNVSVNINKGDNIKEIANILKENGIIQSTFFFLLKSRQMDIHNLQYGTFEFSSNMDFYDIINELQTPNKSEYATLLIKEGDTRFDIAENLENLGVVTVSEFIQVCDTFEFDFDFLKNISERENTLEGYLYPDTYYIDFNDTAEDIINKLLSRFDELFTSDLKARADEIGFSLDQVVTMASIIEKEIRVPSEKPIAASVIFNRLKANMKLQMDSTVLYALGVHKDRVYYSDTEVVSDYNTYYIYGLPIGPICSPSIDTIKAVLYPADTDYIFYVVKDTSTGEHFFTANYDEFLEYKSKYLSNFN